MAEYLIGEGFAQIVDERRNFATNQPTRGMQGP